MLKINIVWKIGDFWLSVYIYIYMFWIYLGVPKEQRKFHVLAFAKWLPLAPFFPLLEHLKPSQSGLSILNHGQKQEQPGWVVLCKRGTTKSWASTWYVLGGMLDHHDKLCQFCWFIWCNLRYSAILPKTTDQTPQDPASAFKARLVLHSYRLLRWSWCYLLAGGPSPS